MKFKEGTWVTIQLVGLSLSTRLWCKLLLPFVIDCNKTLVHMFNTEYRFFQHIFHAAKLTVNRVMCPLTYVFCCRGNSSTTVITCFLFVFFFITCYAAYLLVLKFFAVFFSQCFDKCIQVLTNKKNRFYNTVFASAYPQLVLFLSANLCCLLPFLLILFW